MLWVSLAIFGLDDGANVNDLVASDASPSVVERRSAGVGKKSQHGAPSSSVHTIPTPKATVAYAVSLTSCGVTSDRHDNIRNGGHSSDPSFHEGAAVLKHSIHLSSIRNYHESKSLFDYEVRHVCI